MLSGTTTERDAEKVFAGILIARFRAGWVILKGKNTGTQGNPIGESPVDILKHMSERCMENEAAVGAGARIRQDLEPDTLGGQ